MQTFGIAPVSPAAAPVQCVTGLVFLTPTGLIGAVTGQIIPIVGNQFGLPISIRQVPGPAVRGSPLGSLNGQVATLCGTVVQEGQQFLLNVTTTLPAASAPTGTI